MQNNRFVILTGHLSNHPLSDLVGILRHQKKTGRLLIEYPKGPATFFFKDGELIDARLNDLSGLQAICVALAEPDSAFNFNPLIPPPRRSIDPSLQRAVSEMLGCWDESILQIETSAVAERPAFEPRAEPLALPPAPRMSRLRQRPLLFMAGAVLAGVGLSTFIVVSAGFTANVPVAAQAPSTTPAPTPSSFVSSPVQHRAQTSAVKSKTRTPKTGNTETASNTDQKQEPITVVMQIENGRVVNASIANRKPGMDNYEALALRIARQRRFAPTVNGGQTVTISVNPQQ